MPGTNGCEDPDALKSMTGDEKMSEVRESVKDVIQILHDSHQGFEEIAKHLEDPMAKQLFVQESNVKGEV